MTSNSPRNPEEQGRGDPAATGGPSPRQSGPGRTGGDTENLQAPDGSANVVDGELAMPAGVPERRAGDADGAEAAQWDVAAQDGKRDDPLLASLVTLIGLRDRPMSAEALIAGLPLPDSGLTPELFVRAAERAGLAAKLVKRRIKQISNLTLPCVLLLSPRSACVLVNIDKLNADIQKILDKQTDQWGIKVANVEIKHVDIDPSMIRAIAKQAEAERIRRAKIINAQGEEQAARKLVEAGNILSKEPNAMQLRYFSALHDIAGEKSSTIVFPIPMDLIQHLTGKKGKGKKG